MVAVEVDRNQPAFRCARLHPVRPGLNDCTHLLQRLGEFDVALDRITPDTLDAHRSAADGAKRQEIGRRRRIALDINGPRRHVAAARPDRETLPALTLDDNAKARHRRQRDLDVGLGNQIPDHVDRNRLAGQRQRHQKAGQKLAGNVAPNLDDATRPDRRRLQVQRRIAVIAEVSDVRAQLAQPVDEVADRPLVHAGDALEHVIAASQRQGRRERTERGTSIAEEQFRLLDRKAPAATTDAPRLTPQALDTHPECMQRLEHARRIVGCQEVAHLRLALGQGGKQQNAVGNTLRAGQADAAGGGELLGEVKEFHDWCRTLKDAESTLLPEIFETRSGAERRLLAFA